MVLFCSVIDSCRNFIVPELPCGKILIIDILSTWGDKHYAGLNGIEIFSDTGQLVSVNKVNNLSLIQRFHKYTYITMSYYLYLTSFLYTIFYRYQKIHQI